MNITEELTKVAIAAERMGFVVVWWSPEELGEADPEELRDCAIAAGNDYLQVERDE